MSVMSAAADSSPTLVVWLLLLLLLYWIATWLFFSADQPTVLCASTQATKAILRRISMLHEPFYPTPWGVGCYAQTFLWAAWVPFRTCERALSLFLPSHLSQFRALRHLFAFLQQQHAPFSAFTTDFAAASSASDSTCGEDSPSYCAKAGKLPYRMHTHDEIFTVADGGSFQLTWFLPSTESCAAGAGDAADMNTTVPPDAPLCVIVPGIIGRTDNAYVRRLAARCVSRGWRAVAKGWRGIGCKLTSPRPELWGALAVDDLDAAVTHIRTCLPRAKLFGVGFSYGGATLSSYLGKFGQKRHGMRAVVNVSGIFDMCLLAKHMRTTVFNYVNVASLRWDMWRSDNFAVLSDRVNLEEVERAHTVDQYHMAVTLKYTGHSTVSDYYRQLSSDLQSAVPFADAPQLVIVARDDPVLPQYCWQVLADRLHSNAHTLLVLTRWGGHCGWFDGWTAQSWLDRLIESFFNAVELERQTDGDIHCEATTRYGISPTVNCTYEKSLESADEARACHLNKERARLSE